MNDAPIKLDWATVVLFTPVDGRHRRTGNCEHFVAGELIESVAGLAICRYEGQAGFYLFGCDENWGTITDTWHETLEEAKAQAEFEYEGVSRTWVSTREAEGR